MLSAGQALTVTAVSLLTSLSALTGERLAPSGALSTLPVSMTVLGTLLMVYPAAAIMSRRGRRTGFLLKSALGAAGSMTACVAAIRDSFILFCAGTFVLGLFAAFGLYYRFAALEAAAPLPGKAARALSLVTGAGVLGGIAGPFLAGLPDRFVTDNTDAAGFFILTLVCVLLAVSQAGLSPGLPAADIKEPPARAEKKQPPPPRAGSRLTGTANALCALGFSSMTLVMNAAPLAVHHAGFSLQDSAIVMQAHFMMMYLPAFIVPLIIRVLGVCGLVLMGASAGAAGCLAGLYLPASLLTFIVVLCLSGVSWNFLFSGGTLLFTEATGGTASGRSQGSNSVIVYGLSIMASFLSGYIMDHQGWTFLNTLALALFIVSGLIIAPLMRRSGTPE